METKLEVKERPILFSGPMVRAILDGRKTQTRRVVKLDEWVVGPNYEGVNWPVRKDRNGLVRMPCPYGKPRDRLWVRETWCLKHDGDGFVYNKDGNRDSSCVWYRADGTEVVSVDGDGFSQWNQDGTAKSPWSPSIHMPRWASRITLEITDVRVERLNDISHHDALQEGLIEWSDPPRVQTLHYGLTKADVWETNAPAAFSRLWESINGEGSWDANPWVWVIEFEKVDA